MDDLLNASGRLLLKQKQWRGVTLRPPSRPLAGSYRNLGLISSAVRKRYQWRHLVQLTVACLLVQTGASREAVAARFAPLSADEILGLLAAKDPMAATDLNDGLNAPFDTLNGDVPWLEQTAREFAGMLAAGLVEQFKLAHAGQPVIHGPTLSPKLISAQRRLAALYIASGKDVRHDGAHALIAQAHRPLRASDWDLPVLAQPDFPYAGVRLLDAVTRMPTLDCIDIARHIGSELDMREQQAFKELDATADQFGSRGDEVYSALREYIVRHPLCKVSDMRRDMEAKNMQLAMSFLASCYEPVQPHHLVAGGLHRCPGCGAPMVASTIGGHVCCAVRQCRSFDLPIPAGEVRIASSGLVVAKPHVRMYWCGPGLDEIALHDAAAAAGVQTVLYPWRDKCDLGVDEDRVGVDVKSHANPFLLAAILNADIGGLSLFSRKIIAVNDQAISRFANYLEIARRECVRENLEITSVATLKRELRASP